MAITAKQNEDLQKQYDILKSQGKSTADATASIKSTLQGATTAGGANVFETLKSNFKSGGVAPVEPTVKINTDVMRTYSPDYNPDVPTAISGTLGTKPTDSIARNNQALSGIGEAPVKTPLQLAQEETARKQAELDKRNQEFTALENKGATAEIGAGVIPTTGKTGQQDFLSSTSQFLQTNLKNELANLDKQKQDLADSIKTGALSAEDQKTTLQPYEQFLDKVTKLKDINAQAISREQADLKDRYNTTIDRTRKANDLALINAQKIAAITGVWFTSGGIQGINNIIDEGNQAITSLEGERESMLSKYKDADAKLDIEYLDTITTIQADSKKALQDRYNSVVTQIQKIDAEKGKATKEWLLAIKDVAKEYFDSLDKQWEKDYKMMDFNYKKLLDYKKDVRDQESITRDQQKEQLALIQKGDLTSLTDEDIMNLGQDMDLDNGTIKGLILVREQQKKDAETKQEKPFVVWEWSAVYDPETGTFKTPTTSTGTSEVTAGTKWTRADRNNNPWNVKIGDVGYGVDDKWFTIFPDANTGFNSMINDISAKVNGQSQAAINKLWRQANTLKEMISVYAPAEDQNDPNSYAQAVAKQMGISPDEPLKNLTDRLPELASAMAKHEGFSGSIWVWKTESKTDIQKLAKYMADTQPRWPWFSNEDAANFTKIVNEYADSWDTDTVYQMFRGNILNDKRVNDIVMDNADLKSGLGNLKNILSEYKTSGGDTGVLTNMAETVANYFGRTTSDELAKANNQLGVLVADYIRAISGTAASDKEVARLINSMPKIKNIDEFNTTILDNLSNIADRRAQTAINTKLWFKKDLWPKIFPEFYTTPTKTTPTTPTLKQSGWRIK